MAELEAAVEEGMMRHQKFFKILLPGTFESTLCLPPKFAARLAGCPAAVAATLRDPGGKWWDVEVGRSQQAAWFAGTGWRGFVSGNRLAPGHMLLFDHRGGLQFDVDLFDQSGCLKDGDYQLEAAAEKKSVDRCGEEVEIARSYQLRFLDLSKSVCDRMGWTSSRDVELVNGRRWTVSVKVSGKGGMICGGWSTFASDNHLRLNDTCVFINDPGRLLHHQALASCNQQLFQVHILRSTTDKSYHPSRFHI